MPYLHVFDHSVAVEAVNTILFIENPFSVTHFLIRSWRSCLCQYRRRCGTHLFPPFDILSNLVRKYRSGGDDVRGVVEISDEGLQFVRFFIVDDKHSLVSITQAAYFSLDSNICSDRVWMFHPIHVLLSSSHHSPDILRRDRGSS